MPWVPAVVALVSAATAAYSTVEAKKQAKDAERKQSEINAVAADAAEKQAARDTTLQEEQQRESEAAAAAIAAASGTSGVSEQLFLAELKKKNLEELKWVRQAGETSVARSRLTGEQAVSNISDEGSRRVISGFGQTLGQSAKAFSTTKSYFNSQK